MSLNTAWFPKEVPPKPSGYYAHIIALRVTDSYAVFQTDGELNTARVAAGVNDRNVVTRLAIFKRKQTTPERLTGREMLRRYGFLSDEPVSDPKSKKEKDAQGRYICDYNVAFCTTCPDCITYGFAIGDAGSEKSKVITDTAYSLTSYEHSHEAFTLNAPFEDGTMTRHGKTTSRISEQDHVSPQVIFPAVVTTRDLTESLFLYVLNNVQRARRYGAQTTRTGRLQNHIIGVVLTDGEIFSNLLFTQRLFDVLQDAGKLNPPDPVDVQAVIAAAQEIAPGLITDDGVVIDQFLTGSELHNLLDEVTAASSEDGKLKELLQKAFSDSRAYHQAWIAKTNKGK